MHILCSMTWPSFTAHDDHYTRHDEEDWKNESLRSFHDVSWDRQNSYGFEEQNSPKAERKATPSSPQQRRRDSGISEADSIAERDEEDDNTGENLLTILNRIPVSPPSPNNTESPLLHSERALQMARGSERRKARMEDMYSAHTIQQPSELDITLSPPSPGGELKHSQFATFLLATCNGKDVCYHVRNLSPLTAARFLRMDGKH